MSWSSERVAILSKAAGVAGPLPIFGALTALVFGVLALWDAAPHRDVVLLLSGAMLVLSFAEWTLARRFAHHARAEQAVREESVRSAVSSELSSVNENVANMTMVFDGAATEFAKLRDVVEKLTSPSSVAERVGALEQRVEKIEARIRDVVP